MELARILDLENDGVNMAVDEQCLYVRCKRAMYQYDLQDMRLTAQNVVFQKDGKARGFAIYGEVVFLTDFCDLYILRKEDLQVIKHVRIGENLSSDLGAVCFDSQKAYISIRNGKMAVMDMDTWQYQTHDVCDASFWDHCVAGNRIYAGTVRGELLEIAADSMSIRRKTALCKKNIYSVVWHDGLMYTVSQDMTIKAADVDTFETICTVTKAVKGMAKILGVFEQYLVVADSGKVTVWDRHTLQHCDTLDFPTGAYNKGVILSGDRLWGSDFHSLYSAVLG